MDERRFKNYSPTIDISFFLTSLFTCEGKPPPIVLQACSRFLSPHLQHPIKHHWHFIGDSTMRYMFYELQSPLDKQRASNLHTVKIGRGRCGGLNFLVFLALQNTSNQIDLSARDHLKRCPSVPKLSIGILD